MGVKDRIEIETEVMEKNAAAITEKALTTEGLVVRMDVRKLDHHARIGLPRTIPIRWHNVTTIPVQEFAPYGYPIRYEIVWADGEYFRDGKRIHVTPVMEGVDIDRRVSHLVMEHALAFYVKSGVGLEAVSALLLMIGNVEVSKSALDRWMREMADGAPTREEIVKSLNREKPITEGHLDEIYLRGQDGFAVSIRDEHGRTVVVEKLERKEARFVKAWLQKLELWGLRFRAFYIDDCKAFRQAIAEACPEAKVQIDYFHVLQNATRKLWKRLVGVRRDMKESAQVAWTGSYVRKVTRLAASLWENRGLLFKAEERLSDSERATLTAILSGDRRVSLVRRFYVRFRDVFRESRSEREARIRLGMLRHDFDARRGKVFQRILDGIEEMGEEVFTYLRCRKVQRNSTAETGMRLLRRLENGHDGFRTEEGLDRFIRLWQAITYLRWAPYG